MFLKAFFLSHFFLVSTVADLSDVTYGGIVYLQSNNMDSRWLSEGHIRGTEEVLVRNIFKNEYEQTTAAHSYQWTIQDPSPSQDQKPRNCVKYGDTVYLQRGLWLTGARGSDNEKVLTRDEYYLGTRGDSYKWVVKSTLNSNLDPARGFCVKDMSIIYLQNMVMNYRWLTGGRGDGNEGVLTRNPFSSSEGRGTGHAAYGWIITNNNFVESGERRGVYCAAYGTTGSWVPATYTNADSAEYSFTVAVMEGSSQASSETITKSWESTVTKSLSGGFGFKGLSASTSLEVSSTQAGSITTSVENVFSKSRTESTTLLLKFDKPGTLWQFTMNVDDICNRDVSVLLPHIVSTEDGKEPCCLPGKFLDDDKLYGPCHTGTPCICSDEVCKNSPRRLK